MLRLRQREPVLDLLGSENDNTRPQPTVTSKWSETLNDVTVEEFSFFTGSAMYTCVRDPALQIPQIHKYTNVYNFFCTKHGLLQIEDVNKVCFG